MAIPEGVATNGPDVLRESDGGKRAARSEGATTNGLDVFRQLDAAQRGAILKGSILTGNMRKMIWQLNLAQGLATAERKLNNAWRQLDADQLNAKAHVQNSQAAHTFQNLLWNVST